MSRHIARRVTVEGQLLCLTPLHVGGLDTPSSSDLPLAMNGEGKFYVPGTSLAGPLRAWCRETYPDTWMNLWGVGSQELPVAPDNESEEEKKARTKPDRASFVIVEDAIVEDGALAPEVRDGVGIDRYTGTAADKVKFDREVLPAGTRLFFHLVFEETAGEAENAKIVASLVHALQQGAVPLGASVSRGLGSVRLEKLEVNEQRFGRKEHALAALRGKGVPGGLEVLCADWEEQARDRPLIKIKIEWKPEGPLMVKSGVDGMAVDMLPLTSPKDGSLRLVLPGSSVKGALRSQAERIIATLLDPTEHPELRKNFLKQLARFQIVTDLFGAANASASGENENRHWLPGRSPLSVGDCFSTTEISPDVQKHMLSGASGADLRFWTEGLPELKWNDSGEPYLDPAAHVAIDRWLGGASDGALFSVLEPCNFSWNELEIVIDPARLPRRGEAGNTADALAAIALLLLTLADLVGGEIALGFGANRGLGTAKATELNLDVPAFDTHPDGFVRNVLEDLAGLTASIDGEEGKLRLDGGAVERLRKAWRAGIERLSRMESPANQQIGAAA
ncbi:protein of unknown function DUF324 [Rhodomicrobium vannielii ATCC 17100]|uniref:CRISPR type III-associated protein domain-containing protein n=1 Tax=Rhodomicrobium vannielii (strain ATCC 17100 / DSM 162 / LMG 4299 / NCIMB 10020 / ATH 3.1.1) TaxID=648757 RepID=E3I082_RHOVT|nr:RAMP superfamily CRISPR-associated protein [Rhodomicrobium vannielii]ADP71117.1 protein of unknown function DUF324 [Rhodomicrobium vannielii ATCC 17100]